MSQADRHSEQDAGRSRREVSDPDEAAATISTRLSHERTDLSVLRSYMSAERTLMSWIRTAFSMISFGFTIGKFLDYLANQPDSRLPLGEHNILPKLLVLIGLASLFIGIWEHRHLMLELGVSKGASM